MKLPDFESDLGLGDMDEDEEGILSDDLKEQLQSLRKENAELDEQSPIDVVPEPIVHEPEVDAIEEINIS